MMLEIYLLNLFRSIYEKWERHSQLLTQYVLFHWCKLNE